VDAGGAPDAAAHTLRLVRQRLLERLVAHLHSFTTTAVAASGDCPITVLGDASDIEGNFLAAASIRVVHAAPAADPNYRWISPKLPATYAASSAHALEGPLYDTPSAHTLRALPNDLSVGALYQSRNHLPFLYPELRSSSNHHFTNNARPIRTRQGLRARRSPPFHLSSLRPRSNQSTRA